MELANLWPQEDKRFGGIRRATKADAGAILRLLNTAVYSHLHVDWHLPGDWIGSPGFVVVPKVEKAASKALAARLFPERDDVSACLAATADPLPAAWVRVAALASEADAEQILANMLACTVPVLRQQGATQLAWLAVEEWPGRWLPRLGFAPRSYIETFVKEDRQLPEVASVPGLIIREVYSSDFEALAKLEEASFAPIWRQSARAFAVARPQSLSFDVAVLDDEIVGYQLSARANAGAHLVRLTVNPAKQGLGIGSALLKHAFVHYYRQGLYTVSLNTQVENKTSQKLYLKFGFQPSQQRLAVWTLDIA